jgi:hypothetical protein
MSFLDLIVYLLDRFVQRDHDVECLFSEPVIEMYPDMADEYLASINEPMDFRTIEDLRLSQYQHIQELQDDLVLTFKNVRTSTLSGLRAPFHYLITS